MLDMGTGGGEWLASLPARASLTVAIEHVGLHDDRGARDMQRLRHRLRRAGADRSEEVGLGLDDGRARRSGRLSPAQMPPHRSARPMTAPPWRVPASVHRAGAHSNRALTVEAEASRSSVPRCPAKGTRSASSRLNEDGSRAGDPLGPPERLGSGCIPSGPAAAPPGGGRPDRRSRRRS
jgi:hypothetical protein